MDTRFKNRYYLYFICGVHLMLFSHLGLAQDQAAQYHWYSQGNKIPLTIIPNKVIDFTKEEAASDTLATTMTKTLKPQRTKKLTGGGQLLELNVSSYSNFMNASQQIMKSGSPLFKDGGSIKALPGGVIISFKAGVAENEIQSLCDRYQLKLKKRYSAEGEPAVWLIETVAGLESLRLSNLFFENHSDLVQSSRPNFWQPINTKELKWSDVPQGLKSKK